jgi:hypothetical protein
MAGYLLIKEEFLIQSQMNVPDNCGGKKSGVGVYFSPISFILAF